MSLIRNRKRWISPLETAYLLGLVKLRPKLTAAEIRAAERKAMDSLAHHAERWGLKKIKRTDEDASGCAYTEESVLAYQEARERAA